MTPPRLTFFCELESKKLQDVITKQVIDKLIDLNACLSLGILDFSGERAEVVRTLNQAGIPVIAWLLLPKEDGYWFNLDNAPFAIARYAAFMEWTVDQGLQWERIGLDIEPDISLMDHFARRRWGVTPTVAKRLLERNRLKAGRAAYQYLISRIRSDGYSVDSYQFPVIADERLAGSTFLQRAAGLIDITVDREVWMLYTSFLRPNGAGVLASYAPEAQSIGLGVTGGGVDIDIVDRQPLTWEEFARDLRLAWYWCDDIHVFSLEGCVEQGFLDRLVDFTYDYPILLPEQSLAKVESWRRTLRSMLWVSAHITAILVAAFATALFAVGMKRYLRRKLSG